MPTFEADRGGLLWDATAVPNAFFCEYMPAAPEGHVKVYLYGLMCAHGGMTEEGDLLDDAARALGLTREEVERAMRYWERCRLVERVQDAPPAYRFLNVQQAMLKRREAPRDEAYESFAQAVYAAFGERRKLHGGETVLAYEWVEQLGLPAEVVLMLIQHMIATRGVNFSFKAAQKLAAELAEEHIATIEEAEAVFQRSEAAIRGARRVLSRLGMRRSPSMDEVDLYLKWTEQWGFEPKAVEAACRETTKGAPTFGYLDKVLEGIHSRSGGQATTGKAVERTLEAEREETARIRELLQALGMSRAVVDDGMRRLYRGLAASGGHEAAMLAAREVAASGRAHTLDNVAALLEAWSAKGLDTAQAIEAHLEQVRALNQRIRALMEIAGHRGGMTQANRELLETWEEKWGMPETLIRLAAELARGVEKPMPYMNRLLEGWHAAGVRTEAEARAEHERFQNTRREAAPRRVIEQQYEQRTYDPDEFGELSEEQLEELKRR